MSVDFGGPRQVERLHWPGDSVTMPDGRVWVVSGIGTRGGEQFTMLSRAGEETYLLPTETLQSLLAAPGVPK